MQLPWRSLCVFHLYIELAIFGQLLQLGQRGELGHVKSGLVGVLVLVNRRWLEDSVIDVALCLFPLDFEGLDVFLDRVDHFVRVLFPQDDLVQLVAEADHVVYVVVHLFLQTLVQPVQLIPHHVDLELKVGAQLSDMRCQGGESWLTNGLRLSRHVLQLEFGARKLLLS